MGLCPAGGDGLGDRLGRKHCVQAVIRSRMKMGELPIDQEGLRRPNRFARCQDERPSARHGNAAGFLDDARQCKDTLCQFLNPAQVRWLLIELGVRVGRCRARALANPRGQRGHRPSLRRGPPRMDVPPSTSASRHAIPVLATPLNQSGTAEPWTGRRLTELRRCLGPHRIRSRARPAERRAWHVRSPQIRVRQLDR